MGTIITDDEIKEELLTTKESEIKPWCFTVQDLLDYIYKYDIDRNSPIFVERIEDKYFTEHNWKTIKKPNIDYPETNSEFFDIFSYIKYREDNKLYLTAHY